MGTGMGTRGAARAMAGGDGEKWGCHSAQGKGWRMEDRKWRTENGGWRTDNGGWKMKDG